MFEIKGGIRVEPPCQATIIHVRPGSPIPTVEVDTLGLGADQSRLVAALQKPLAAFAKAKPKVAATLYLYIGPSFNFGEPTLSAFVAVAGPVTLLQRVHAALTGTFSVRYGD